MKILGVDPGSLVTGYGCIALDSRRLNYVSHGVLRLGTSAIPIEERLSRLYVGLGEIMTACRPDVVSLEKAFFSKNAVSALRLGEARGVIMVLAQQRGVLLREFAPTEVKAALTGFGRAGKEQIQTTVQILLGRQHFVGGETRHDATDALGLAICAAQLTGRPRVETFR